jgi:hypothetical protein
MNESIAASRKELHASISPAVYSKHARTDLIPTISKLAFIDERITDPIDLAKRTSGAFYLTPNQIENNAKNDGIYELAETHKIFARGYGDRNFTNNFAGWAGRNVAELIERTGLLDKPLSLMDYGKMFQTGWFGQIANQAALTGPAVFQGLVGCRGLDYSRSELELYTKRKIEKVFDTTIDPESSLLTIVLTKEIKAGLRGLIDSDNSIGCPVARTSFTATERQVAFLEKYNHLGPDSGYYEEEELTTSGLVKITRPAYTVIDETLWQWGDYVSRYGTHLLGKGEDPNGIAPTNADEVLLLN